MCISSTEYSSRFTSAILAYVTDSITSETDFNFGNKWKYIIAIPTKENVFWEDLPSKFQANGARSDIFDFTINSYASV